MANQPDPKFPTFSDLYNHLLTLPSPLLPPGKATSPQLTASISALFLHPTLETAFHILNNDLPSAHFLVRHMQSPPAYEGMFLHGILHRIEGDYDNARAWYGNVSDSDVFKHTWPGGKDDALDLIARVEKLKKDGNGNGEELGKESLEEIQKVVEWCKQKFGEQRMDDASEAWVQPSEEKRKMAEDMPSNSVLNMEVMNVVFLLYELYRPKRPKLLTPRPEASVETNREFLTTFFVNAFAFSRQQALFHARQFDGNGDDFYAMSPRRLDALFLYHHPDRILGMELYLELHLGKYGKYRNFWYYAPFLGILNTALGVAVTIFQIDNNPRFLPGLDLVTVVFTMAKLQLSNKSSGGIDQVPAAPSSSVSTTLDKHTETPSDTVIDTTTQSAGEDDASRTSKAWSHSSPSRSRSRSSSVSVYSDTLTSMEYPDSAVYSDTLTSMEYPEAMWTPPDTTSHTVTIDPPTLDYRPCSAVLHPDASLKEVREFLTAYIVDTLHRLEGQALVDAEAHALEYVARFVNDLEQHAHPMDAMAATHLYKCSEERLCRIFGEDPEPPRIVRRVCHQIYFALQSSKYGKDSNRLHILLNLAFQATFWGFVLNIMAFCDNEPTLLATSIVFLTLLHLSLKGLFRYAFGGLPSKILGKKLISRRVTNNYSYNKFTIEQAQAIPRLNTIKDSSYKSVNQFQYSKPNPKSHVVSTPSNRTLTMSRNDTYLSLCLEQASLSSLHYRHGCIIVRGGKIIGKGYNDYRSGFNGGAQSTGKLGLHGPKQTKNPQDHRPRLSGTKKNSAGTYVAFESQDHAVGAGGGSLANTPLSMHSEMMAINSALSLSSAIACQGTARSTQWLQKPCFKLPSRSKRQSRLQHLKAYADAIYQAAEDQATALDRRAGSHPPSPNNMQHEQVDYYNVEEEKKKKKKNKVSKRNNPGNNNVHHYAQINYLEFQKANAQKALRQPPSDNDEKHRRQYLYGMSDKQQTPPHPQQHNKTSAIVMPQNRIVTKSHQVAERTKDSRLKGADLYVTRLGKTGKSNHYNCGCQYQTPSKTTKSTSTNLEGTEQPTPKAKPPTGSLHDEFRFPSPSEKPKPTIKPGEHLTATHSRPCYRCISYMHSAGIKRVFWTNTKGEWEGGKVRDLVDALEGPVPEGSMGAGAVYVTKSEVLLLKGLK
ncbi:MAG: hypothetical protein Q9226_005498 [Calogaya cf. arnoldii]